MSDGPYRQAAQTVTKRRHDADETIAACDERLEPLAIVFLPAELRARIDRLRAGGDAATDEAREELASSLEEALEVAKERDFELRHLPDEHPTPLRQEDLWGPTGTEQILVPTLERVRWLVQQIDPHATVTRTGPRVTARFRTHGRALLWSIHFSGGLALQAGGDVVTFSKSSHWLGVRVPDGAPDLFLRPEGFTDTVLKALRLRTEVEVDDAVFDDAMFVEGDHTFARAVLTNVLRSALVQRGEHGEFSFWLHKGSASVAWKGGLMSGLLTEKVLPPSIAVLLALRDALGALRLVRST